MNPTSRGSKPRRATGWANGLSQDYCRGLSLWFAGRVDARWTVRRWFGDTTTQPKGQSNAK